MVFTGTKKLDTEGLKQKVPLLRKYLDDDKERGTQALFAVQHLLCELEHPQGKPHLPKHMFQKCCVVRRQTKCQVIIFMVQAPGLYMFEEIET